MNEDKILYSFNIVNNKIQVYDRATNKILAFVNNKFVMSPKLLIKF